VVKRMTSCQLVIYQTQHRHGRSLKAWSITDGGDIAAEQPQQLH
jgi:hypothetical protein